MSEIEGLERRAYANLGGGTYTDEHGVLRCAVCHEPRMKFVQAMGKEVPVSCSCYDASVAERNLKERVTAAKNKAETNPLFDRSYDAFVFDADKSPESAASKQCRAYVERWESMERENMGLLFSGTLGTGKSFYAAAVVNSLRSRGVSALIVTTSRLVNTLRASKDPQGVIDELNSFQLVALDDLGAERDTDYAVEQLEIFINDRSLAGRPLLVTTNLTGKDLTNPPDLRYARIFDRVLVMCQHPVILTGASRRAEQRKVREKRFLEILGD